MIYRSNMSNIYKDLKVISTSIQILVDILNSYECGILKLSTDSIISKIPDFEEYMNNKYHNQIIEYLENTDGYIYKVIKQSYIEHIEKKAYIRMTNFGSFITTCAMMIHH